MSRAGSCQVEPAIGNDHLAEFDFRYNTRKTTDGARTIIGLRKADGKRLMLRRPTAKRA
jgi:hypothetical protein